MDNKTLMIAMMALSVGSSVVMGGTYRTRKTYPGFGYWTCAIFASALGTVVFSLRSGHPSWLNLVVSNTLLVSSFVLIYRGMRVFRGGAPHTRRDVGVLLSFVVLMGYFSLEPQDINGRIAVYSVYVGMLALATVRTMLRQRPAYFGANEITLSGWFGFVGVFSLVRAFYSGWFKPDIPVFMFDSGFQSLFLLAQILTVLLGTLTLIGINTQRLEYDLRATQEALQQQLAARARVESDLQRSQQRYQLLTEHMSDNVWTLDTQNWRLTYVSPSVERITGFSVEDMLAMASEQVFAHYENGSILAQLQQRHQDFLAARIHSEHYFTDVIELPCKDGSWVWTEINSHFVRDPVSGAIELHGVTRDITQRKQTEVELIAAKSKLQGMLDALPDLLFEIGPDGVIHDYRSPRSDLLAVAPEVFIGQPISGILPPDVVAVVTAALDEAVDRGVSMGHTYALVLPHGVRWFELSLAAKPQAAGENARYIGLARDITERQQMQKALEERTAELQRVNADLHMRASHDVLTGLHNRLAANDRLRTEFLGVKRSRKVYTVLMLDIDFFKRVNDTHGHAIGDQVLVHIAQVLRATLRESDFIARYGGEEFLALLPATDLASAYPVAEKLRQAVEATPDPVAGRVTVSVGLALATPDQVDEEVAVREADDQLYTAKKAGRNRVSMAAVADRA